MFDIDFYQHMVLATWLFILAFRWLKKRQTFMFVMGIAFLWEVAEMFYNLDAYSDINHFLKDTLFDLSSALIACAVCIFILRETR